MTLQAVGMANLGAMNVPGVANMGGLVFPMPGAMPHVNNIGGIDATNTSTTNPMQLGMGPIDPTAQQPEYFQQHMNMQMNQQLQAQMRCQSESINPPAQPPNFNAAFVVPGVPGVPSTFPNPELGDQDTPGLPPKNDAPMSPQTNVKNQMQRQRHQHTEAI